MGYRKGMLPSNIMNKLKILIPPCLILIIVTIAFLPSLKNGFVSWDDSAYVIENKVVRVLSWDSIKIIFGSFHQKNYHPLSLLSYALEYHFFKLDPRIYHITNLTLHLLNCLLIFWLILALNSGFFIALIAALLFGLHPLHVESVVWISERRDMLYSFFFLGALNSYLYHIKDKSRNYYYLAILLFILSLLAKAMAITLPLVLFLIDYIFGNRSTKNNLKDKIPFFMISIIFGVITFIARYSSKDITPDIALNFYYYATIASFELLFYMVKMIAPVKLSCLYPYAYNNLASFGSILFFCPSILAILAAGIVFSRRYTKKIIFGTVFFIITISPVMLPFGSSLSIVYDRYFYIPSIGLFFITAEGFVWLYTRRTKYNRPIQLLLLIILVVLICTLTAITQKRCRVWKDSVSLYSDVLENYPDIATAYNNRGAEFLKNREYDKAYSDLINTINIDRNYYEAYFNLGSLYKSTGNYKEAIRLYAKTIEINPAYLEAYNMLIELYGTMGNHTEAMSLCKKVIKDNPNYALGYCNLCSAYGNVGNFKEAIAACRKALQIDSGMALAHFNLSAAYYYTQQYDLAIRHCDKAIELGYAVSPKFLELLESHRK